jgi:hypothetical protein
VIEKQQTQAEVFECFRQIAEDAVNGVSSGILAYGQTGSGKVPITRKNFYHVWQKPVSEAALYD